MTSINVDMAVEDRDGWVFTVELNDPDSSTRHSVYLSRETFENLRRCDETSTEFIKRSFEFLLKREPKNAILGSFDILDINRYFPEFEETMTR